MGSNKHLVQDTSQLLRTKLDKLSTQLQGSLLSESISTQEGYILEVTRTLRELYKSLNEPQMDKAEILVDSSPDMDEWNTLWNQLLDDLTTIFTELENLETLTVANFNFVTTESNRLTTRLKSVSSKVGDYILYSLNPNKDALFFVDSFNDLSKIEVNSSLLNTEQCEVNQEEGIVTLPIDVEKESVIRVTEAAIINPNSNGVVGNNQELGMAHNGDISVILDNNPDTWFEYEKVVTRASSDRDPLLLDLTINLGSEKVINHIRVNPNNFGTKTIIEIEEIETSIDGQAYTSIKDDIPIAGFTTEDEENIFVLAPSTSKYAGQGIYTFTPRKVKYIHCVFKQPEAYNITTTAGTRLRYAIGLRDITINALHYREKGEIVSSAFEAGDEIRKVLLETNQNPSQLSELASITYLISHDNGGTWNQIQPKGIDPEPGVVSVPEVLEYNSVDPDSIDTSVPVQSLRLKAVLVRDNEAFLEGSSTLKKTVEIRSELHSVPEESPFTFFLERPPVDNTVIVVDPLFGSRGMEDSPHILGHAHDRLDMKLFRLPFEDIPRPVEKIITSGTEPIKYDVEPVAAADWVHVEVGGEEWSHATQPLSQYTADWENNNVAKVFVFNPNEGTLEFGNNLTTLAPAENAPITLWFEAERLFPSADEDKHLARLDFPTGSNKEDFTIKRYDKIEQYAEVLPRKATVIRLQNQNLTDISHIQTVLGPPDQKTFVNGRDELSGSSDWSIDVEKGIIYLKSPTSDQTDSSIAYWYQPIHTLTSDEWDWGETALLRDSVMIKEAAWRTIPVEDESVRMVTGARVLDLSQLSVVKGTLATELEGNEGDDDNPFLKEVTFVDGVTELGGSIKKATEQIPSFTSGLNSFTTRESITSTTTYAVSFSNTSVFQTDVSPATPSVDGEYKVDRSTNQIQIYVTDSTDSAGTVTYFYEDTNFSDEGLFSVNYPLGKIYTQRSMSSSWTLVVNFEYVDFRAEYRIARLLDANDYEVDITNQSVTVKDRETFRQLLTPKTGLYGRNNYYLVNYNYVKETRENIEDLQELFSPIIKDFSLRVLTKSRIF
jgi:hypothetical protein